MEATQMGARSFTYVKLLATLRSVRPIRVLKEKGLHLTPKTGKRLFLFNSLTGVSLNPVYYRFYNW
jgi:hypothetical protein